MTSSATISLSLLDSHRDSPIRIEVMITAYEASMSAGFDPRSQLEPEPLLIADDVGNHGVETIFRYCYILHDVCCSFPMYQ